MVEGMKFNLYGYIADESDLAVGKYYYFYDEVYLYCGCVEPFANSHAFGCIGGTRFVNKAQMKKIIEEKKVRISRLAKDN